METIQRDTAPASPKYVHKEAFCLMWYACKSCGHRERIWNSRDGVTPFGCDCPSCSAGIMHHVRWEDDACTPDHNLKVGQKFWRDGTADEAEGIMRRRIEKAKGTRWEATAEVAENLIRCAREEGEGGEFQKGWPMFDIFRSGHAVA
jgi:hypothetical protein